MYEDGRREVEWRNDKFIKKVEVEKWWSLGKEEEVEGWR